MKHFFFLLAILLLINNASIAQHCPYDNTYILVIKVTPENDSTVISGLKITLLDSLQKTRKWSQWNGQSFESKEVCLYQNPKATTQGQIDNLNPLNPTQVRFPFANNNYLLVTGRNLDHHYLKIEDIDKKENGGKFKTKIIPINNKLFYSLCTGHSRWQYGGNFVEEYQPLEIKLTRKL